jgi:hypothetical protein
VTSKKTEAAIQSLSRVRVAETCDADGLRRVWHQGEDVDLLSWVDKDGKLLRQELTLFGDHFQWTSVHGMRTGRVNDADGSAAAHSAELISLDTTISEDRLSTAKQALDRYDGDDKYVLHVKHVVGQFLRGLQERDEVVITATTAAPHEPPSVPVPRRSWTTWVVAAAVGVIALATLLLLTR